MKFHPIKSVSNSTVSPVANLLDSTLVGVTSGCVMHSFSEAEFIRFIGLLIKECKEGDIKILRSSKRKGTFCLRHIHSNGTVSVIGFAKLSGGNVLFSNGINVAA